MCVVIIAVLGACPLHAYSQITHEELIDLLWADSIRPLLLQRYPQTTESALKTAHAYAYGGCLIQDIGYYPLGKVFFSDLAHHVRTGDFVATLLRNATTVDELAFAIGALSHYVGDSVGHADAVNPGTALTFPDLRWKYGAIVTYEQAPVAHGRTEFGFDVAQTVWKRYAPRAYRKRVGFRVARQLLYSAFQETYGLRARGILGPARSALRTYRWAVTSLLPAFLGAQRVLLGSRLPAETDDEAREQFLLTISRSEYALTAAKSYSEPGVRAHMLAFVVLVIPKVGRLKVLATKSPTTQTEELFLRSLNYSVEEFRELLRRLGAKPDFPLDNLDLDTGHKMPPGESVMVEKIHAELTTRIVEQKGFIPPGIRNYVLMHYSDPEHPVQGNTDQKMERRLASALEVFRISDP